MATRSVYDDKGYISIYMSWEDIRKIALCMCYMSAYDTILDTYEQSHCVPALCEFPEWKP